MTVRIIFEDEAAYDHAIREAKAQALHDAAESFRELFGGMDPGAAFAEDLDRMADNITEIFTNTPPPKGKTNGND